MNPKLRTLPTTVNRLVTWALALAGLLAAQVMVCADTIYLRNGEKVIGKVIENEKTEIVIESQSMGRLKIPRERVERVELDPAPAPVAPPVKPVPGQQPLVNTSPVVIAIPPMPQTNWPPPATVNTNPPAKRRWFWQSRPPTSEASADWIQLKSGEWLRGKLYGMQKRTLEFDSDELDDLEFDWKDVHQLWTPRALVSYGELQKAWGKVAVNQENVTVTGLEQVTFPRYDLLGIAPGSPREIDYWSGRFNVGLNMSAGNTEEVDMVTKFKLERRTANTHLELDYIGNFSEQSGVESVNNQRATEYFDIFLTRRFFLRIPQSEYYHDPFQNIDYRFTVGGGLGYYLIDLPKAEWQIAGGPAYQRIRYETVEAGEAEMRSTPAFGVQTVVDLELTKRIDLELGYTATIANEDSGGLMQRGTATLEIDLTSRLDLDITFSWDRIGNPQADSTGAVPEKNDFRLDLSLGVTF